MSATWSCLFVSKPMPWNFHDYEPLDTSSTIYSNRLDLLLERSDCKGFHNGPCGLGLHLHLLAECHPHTCFCGSLQPGLDTAEAWDGEHSGLLHLLGGTH